MDGEGNVTTPESNVVNFTHSSGNLQYETVLTEEEAAEYTVANIYGEWAPDKTAAQVELTAEDINHLADFNASLLFTAELDGELMYAIGNDIEDFDIEKAVAEMMNEVNVTSYTVRVANSRGGFGPAFDLLAYYNHIVSIEQVEAQPATVVSFNLFGQPVKANDKGICIVNGQKVIR